jgi:hypothetical protein
MLVQQETIQFSEHSTLQYLIVPQKNLLRKVYDLIDFSFITVEDTQENVTLSKDTDAKIGINLPRVISLVIRLIWL